MQEPVIFVDLGAFDGRSTRLFEKLRPIKKAYLWECHPDIVIKPPKCDHEIIRAAAWTHDGEIDFYVGEHQGKVTQGSSLLESKTTGWLDKEHPVRVPCRDFCEWMWANEPGWSDLGLVVKMNIEGAEYELLQYMDGDDWLDYPDEWHISWHSDKVGMTSDTDEHWRSALESVGYTPIDSPFPGHEGWRR